VHLGYLAPSIMYHAKPSHSFHAISFKSVLITSIDILVFEVFSFLRVFPSRNVHAFHISAMSSTRPDDLIPFYLLTLLTIFDEENLKTMKVLNVQFSSVSSQFQSGFQNITSYVT
jgi:hypothetical protein